MLAALKLEMLFTTTQARTTCVNAVLADLSAALGQVTDIRDTNENGDIRWVLCRRVQTSPTGAAATVRTQMGLATTKNGSVVHLHDCRHDETPQGSCSKTAEWRKVNGSVVRTI